MGKFKRAFVIVLDSYGIGQEPDAADFGDGVCNTLKSIVASDKYDTPNMKKLGLFNIDGVGCGQSVEKPLGSFARLRELSRGKDTTTGHWEIAGIVSERPMPTYPDGFPAD
ncbi:MAG: phosphopentomutase, partial [Selenomonas sp.]|nr:phosphopentomutase [Selenomonas sp.]